MAPSCCTTTALPSLSMESSSMAPNHGAKAPHEADAGTRWHGLVLTTLFPLVLGTQTQPMENESGGQGLTIMWPPFIHKKQQPTECCCRLSGWFWKGDAMEVGCVRRMLMHRFDYQAKPQKNKNENNTLWPLLAKNKQKCTTTN